MTGMALLSVAVGAVIGAWLRWALGLLLNALVPAVPPGTLAANLLGGYVAGAALAYFVQFPNLPPEWRLLIITGFCGGLTTFSTFSLETATLLQQGRLGLFGAAVALHVGGSIAMTLAGIATVQALVNK